MDIALGMHVQTRDGQDLGSIDRLVVDPATNRIRAAVVRRGPFLRRDVEIPLAQLRARSAVLAQVQVAADEVDQLPDFLEASYTMPPAGFMPPLNVPVTGLYWPVGEGLLVPTIPGEPIIATPTAGAQTAPAMQHDWDATSIGVGSAVIGADGQPVGQVQGLTLDPQTQRLTHIVVRRDLPPGEEEELPALLIDRIEAGVLYLRVAAGAALPS